MSQQLLQTEATLNNPSRKLFSLPLDIVLVYISPSLSKTTSYPGNVTILRQDFTTFLALEQQVRLTCSHSCAAARVTTASSSTTRFSAAHTKSSPASHAET